MNVNVVVQLLQFAPAVRPSRGSRPAVLGDEGELAEVWQTGVQPRARTDESRTQRPLRTNRLLREEHRATRRQSRLHQQLRQPGRQPGQGSLHFRFTVSRFIAIASWHSCYLNFSSPSISSYLRKLEPGTWNLDFAS